MLVVGVVVVAFVVAVVVALVVAAVVVEHKEVQQIRLLLQPSCFHVILQVLKHWVSHR